MADYGYEWRDTVAYSTRHMPRALLKRLRSLAVRMDHSVEWTLNRALDIGVTKLEKDNK